MPGDRAPGRDHLGIVGFRLVRAACRTLGGDSKQLPRIRGGVVQPAVRIAVERRHLLGTRPRQEGRFERIALEPVQLAFVAGADDQRATGIERQLVRRVVARFP